MPDKLTLAQRLDLYADPRMKDPAIRYQVLQKLDPEDKAWLLESERADAPPDTQAWLKGKVEGAADYARQNPAETGAIVGGLLAAPLTGSTSAWPAMAAAGLGGAGGAGLGLLTSAALDPTSPAPRTSTGVVADMAKQGALQAGMEGGVRGVATALRAGAPKVMELGLQRPRSAQLDFPNAATRLVDESIIPRGTNVERALNATERKIGLDALQFDLAAAGLDRAGVPTSMRKALPPARTTIPLGEAPKPSGGRPAVQRANVTQLREQNQSTRLQGLHPDNPFDPIFGQGPQSGSPQATGDVPRGPGVMFGSDASRARPTPLLPNAPMADPFRIADEARAFAFKEGKMGGLGDAPGPEVANLNAARDQYLKQNTRPRSLTETIEQKRSYQARSRYNNRPNAPTQTNESALFDKGVAAANRSEAIRLLPSLENDLSKEQDLLGALTALQTRSKNGMPNTVIGAAKHLAFQPGVMGTAAIGMNRTGRALQRLSPAQIRAAFNALLAMSQDAQDGQ